MAGQAKCPKCRIRYVWDPYYLPKDIDEATKRVLRERLRMNKTGSTIVKKPLFMLACPRCGTGLEMTSYLSKLTVSPQLPVYADGMRARRLRKRSRNG